VKNLVIVAALCLLVVGVSRACTRHKRKSLALPQKPLAIWAAAKTLTVDYSSPRMKGRKIFGGLVPYGEVWRFRSQ